MGGEKRKHGTRYMWEVWNENMERGRIREMKAWDENMERLHGAKTWKTKTWDEDREHVMSGRSRRTTDSRTPTMPRRDTSGFHRPGRHCMYQAQSAVRCSASSVKGELHPTTMMRTACEAEFLAYG